MSLVPSGVILSYFGIQLSSNLLAPIRAFPHSFYSYGLTFISLAR
jgi:hypothetical protein